MIKGNSCFREGTRTNPEINKYKTTLDVPCYKLINIEPGDASIK